MDQTEQTACLLAIHSLFGAANTSLKKVLDFYGGDAVAAWQDSGNWQQIEGCDNQSVLELAYKKGAIDLECLYQRFLDSDAHLLSIYEATYPRFLKDIHNPPPLLFYRGTLPATNDLCLAMVGSRRATAYGRQVGQMLAHDLSVQGITVVSGMARGIDSVCHQAALAAGGRTIAILGSGIDVVYPRENNILYQQIIKNGAVISEQPLGMEPLPHNFPLRNRIISGLSRGVVVIEAGHKSGTLLTVDFALEQGRDVFAVPGNINQENCYGTNNLLKQGAIVVTEADDIVNVYLDDICLLPQRVIVSDKNDEDIDNSTLTKDERVILAKMIEPISVEKLQMISGWEYAKLSTMLLLLELRGLIAKDANQCYYALFTRHKL